MSKQLIDPKLMDQVLQMIAQGESISETARVTGLPETSICSFLINLGRGLTLQTITLPDPEPSELTKRAVLNRFVTMRANSIGALAHAFGLKMEQIEAILAEKEVR